MHQRLSCPHPRASSESSHVEIKVFSGLIFANEKNSGWTKLNSVKACTRCRSRHVRCSLIDTGGPCTHCRNRKEVCKVLGWEMRPDEPTKIIYKRALPPKKVLGATQPELQATSRVQSSPVEPKPLKASLEKLSPRALALLKPWAPENQVPCYPEGPKFGEQTRNFSESFPNRTGLAAPNSGSSSVSPPTGSPLPFPSSEGKLTDLPSYSEKKSLPNGRQKKGVVGEEQRGKKLNRMSLDFILSNEYHIRSPN